jgi:quercetin dioxygenase-like cupin family protein
MKDDSTVNERIAQQVRHLRGERGLSLDALSTQCGVSRSMLSLFDDPARKAEPISRHADQVTWQDPHSGYVRRNISPEGFQAPTRIVDVTFPPRTRVTYEAGPRTPAVLQQIWILEGRMEIVYGADSWLLEAGDCLAIPLDAPNSFHNPGDVPARYAVVLTTLARS